MFSFGIVLCEVGHVSSHGFQTHCSSPLFNPLTLQLDDPGNMGPQSQTMATVGYGVSLTIPSELSLESPGSGAPINRGLCAGQIIGRVNADPDYLPRTMDFGLNVRGFLDRYCPPNCPPSFFPITVRCCDLDPEKR